jgi:ribonuclease VapC
MILDSSALVAIFTQESGHEGLIDAVAEAPAAGVGAPTLVEAGIVLSVRMRLDARPLLARFLHDFGIIVVPFGEDHWREALDAFNRFGKGRHPAGLNLGDCFSYAVASLAEQPLLCIGDDFRKTDLPVLPA